jgi:phage baseplate assembly protein W
MTPDERAALIDMVEADYEAMDRYEERFELLRALATTVEGDWTDGVDALVDLGV